MINLVRLIWDSHYDWIALLGYVYVFCIMMHDHDTYCCAVLVLVLFNTGKGMAYIPECTTGHTLLNRMKILNAGFGNENCHTNSIK